MLDDIPPATRLLLIVNVLVFGAVAALSGTLAPSGRTLLAYGALYPGAIQYGDTWRLVASGFLHFTPVHLLFNMMCLLSWGSALERRLGVADFVLLYAVSLLGGSLVAAYEPRAITAGASGAIWGLLGALLYLSLRRKVDMPLSGIAVTVALNVAFTVGASSISWRAHVGGFAAGLLTCLGLAASAWVGARTLRCRFPDWLGLDLLAVAVLAAAAWQPRDPVTAALLLLDILLLVKAVDLVLCLRRGLAMVAAAMLAAQAALLAWAGAGHGRAGLGVAAALLAVSAWLHWRPLRRGLRDQGFIAAGLQAERGRVREL